MSSKQKGQSMAREKGIPVASDSMQTRPPGSRQSGSADVLSANAEQGTSYLRNRNAEQGEYTGSAQGDRGAGTAQHAGWSSRQQAQRMQARAEEERLGAARQSGEPVAQQEQRGSMGSMQSGQAGAAQREAGQPSASPGGRKAKKRGGKR
jgi:hypothetical protein